MISHRIALLLLNTIAVALLLAASAVAPSTIAHSQDQSFRLINIERRLDQLQGRLDFLERARQNQSLNDINSANVSTQAVLDLQRQQLALADQVVTMQRRLLEMQKALDQLAERGGAPPKLKPEKKEKPKEDIR